MHVLGQSVGVIPHGMSRLPLGKAVRMEFSDHPLVDVDGPGMLNLDLQ